MYKYLYGLVVLGFVCLGLGALGHLLPPLPQAYDKPSTAQMKACYDTQEHIHHATTEDYKATLLWWCIKRQPGLNR